MARTGRQRYGLEAFTSTSFSCDPRLIDALERARAELYPEANRSALIAMAVREWIARNGLALPPPAKPRTAPRKHPRRPATPILEP